MHLVLVEPEIPGNTGNVGRSCVGNGVPLHLVGRCGFSLDDKYLKRAGLDYWQHLDLRQHSGWEEFLQSLPQSEPSLLFFEKDGAREHWTAPYTEESYLIFGSETRGFPQEIVEKYGSFFYRIPMTGPIRSLNLSSAAAVVLYEALRQTKYHKEDEK